MGLSYIQHFLLADNIWGKTSWHLSWCLPQAFAFYHLPLNWFSSIVDTIKDEQLHIFCQPAGLVGRIFSSGLGVSQYVPPFETIPGYPGDSIRALISLPCRGMGWCQEVPEWLGIPPNITQENHWGRDGIQPSHGMGTPMPRLHLFLEWGGEETHPTHHFQQKLGLCICAVYWWCPTCPLP